MRIIRRDGEDSQVINFDDFRSVGLRVQELFVNVGGWAGV